MVALRSMANTARPEPPVKTEGCSGSAKALVAGNIQALVRIIPKKRKRRIFFKNTIMIFFND